MEEETSFGIDDSNGAEVDNFFSSFTPPFDFVGVLLAVPLLFDSFGVFEIGWPEPEVVTCDDCGCIPFTGDANGEAFERVDAVDDGDEKQASTVYLPPLVSDFCDELTSEVEFPCCPGVVTLPLDVVVMAVFGCGDALDAVVGSTGPMKVDFCSSLLGKIPPEPPVPSTRRGDELEVVPFPGVPLLPPPSLFR